MNARTFGTDAKFQESLERHNAKYGTADPVEQGRMIIEAQREGNARREQETYRADWTAPAVKLASEKSVEFMTTLWLERSDKATAEQVRAWGRQQEQATVSAKITWLLDQPKLATRTPIPDVPAGRYAVTGEQGQTVFLKVDRPTEGQYAGRTFVKVQAGDDFHRMPLPVAKGLLAKILADGPKAASVRYGRELGVCGVCGRTLTDAESREAGIGPVCATRF
jgi:hypothetical protein